MAVATELVDCAPSPITGKYLALVSDCEQMAVVGQPFDTAEAAREFAESQSGVSWLVVKVEDEGA